MIDDEFAAFAAPDDPFARLADDEDLGDLASAHALRELSAAVDAHAWDVAQRALLAARAGGIPVELQPHVAVLETLVLIEQNDAATAIRVAGDAWREFPDVAALAAVLGVARVAAGHAAEGSRALFAAIIEEDPDRTLAVHRRRLTSQLQRIGHAAESAPDSRA